MVYGEVFYNVSEDDAELFGVGNISCQASSGGQVRGVVIKAATWDMVYETIYLMGEGS